MSRPLKCTERDDQFRWQQIWRLPPLPPLQAILLRRMVGHGRREARAATERVMEQMGFTHAEPVETQLFRRYATPPRPRRQTALRYVVGK